MTTTQTVSAAAISRLLAKTETRSRGTYSPGFIVTAPARRGATGEYAWVDHRADQFNADGTARTTYTEQGAEVDRMRQRYIDILTAAGYTAELRGPHGMKKIKVTR